MAELMTIARPYAEAAFAVAKEANALDQWSEQLAIMAAITSDEATKRFMGGPKASSENLTALFKDVMGDKLTTEGANLLSAMAENKRLIALPEVCEIFETLKAEEESRVRATVISALPVTEEQKNTIKAALNTKYGAEVEVSYEEDSALIAGIKIKVGDWAIDGSAATQLSKLGAAIAQ